MSVQTVPLSEITVRMRQSSVIYYYWEKLTLSDISYYLSQERYFVHICIVKKEVKQKQKGDTNSSVISEDHSSCVFTALPLPAAAVVVVAAVVLIGRKKEEEYNYL